MDRRGYRHQVCPTADRLRTPLVTIAGDLAPGRVVQDRLLTRTAAPCVGVRRTPHTSAGGTLRDLRVAEVVAQDIHLAEDGGITYRTKVRVSFKYEPGE